MCTIYIMITFQLNHFFACFAFWLVHALCASVWSVETAETKVFVNIFVTPRCCRIACAFLYRVLVDVFGIIYCYFGCALDCISNKKAIKIQKKSGMWVAGNLVVQNAAMSACEKGDGSWRRVLAIAPQSMDIVSFNCAIGACQQLGMSRSFLWFGLVDEAEKEDHTICFTDVYCILDFAASIMVVLLDPVKESCLRKISMVPIDLWDSMILWVSLRRCWNSEVCPRRASAWPPALQLLDKLMEQRVSATALAYASCTPKWREFEGTNASTI